MVINVDYPENVKHPAIWRDREDPVVPPATKTAIVTGPSLLEYLRTLWSLDDFNFEFIEDPFEDMDNIISYRIIHPKYVTARYLKDKIADRIGTMTKTDVKNKKKQKGPRQRQQR